MQRSVEIFDNTIHSEHTRKLYRHHLQKFLEFTKIKDFDSLLRVDPNRLETMLEDYIIYLKSRLSPNTIPVAFAPIEKFLIANRVNLNFRRLRMMFPAKVKKSGHRAWTTTEIQKMLGNTTKLRTKAIIHMLASTSCRAGVVEELKLKHLSEMPLGCKAVLLYEGSTDEYWDFLTPEASIALDEYLTKRRKDGENLTPESPVFRDDYQLAIAPAKPMTKQMAQMLIYKCVERAGVARTKIGRRYDVQIAHGFRKRFNTILKMNNSVNANIAEKLMGHKKGLDGVYLTPTREECFREFAKAIPDLTVSDTERLRVKNQILEEEKSYLVKQIPDLVNQAVQRTVEKLHADGCIVDVKKIKIN